MKLRIKTSLLPALALLASGQAFAYPATTIAFGAAAAVQVAGIESTLGVVESELLGTNINTGQSLAILQRNFGLLGGGFVNSSLSEIAGKIESQTVIDQQLSDLQTENMFHIQTAMQIDKVNKDNNINKSVVDLCISATAARKIAAGKKAVASKKAKTASRSTSRSVSTTSPTAAGTKISKVHEERYCSVEEKHLGKCEKISEYPNADISFSTVLNGAVKMEQERAPDIIKDDTGEVVGVIPHMKTKEGEPEERLTYDEATTEAVQRVVDNMINPVPDKSVKSRFKDSDNYHDYQSMFLARQSRLSAANKVFDDIQAEHSPEIELGPWLEAISADGSVEFDEKLIVDGKVSEAELRKFEVGRRYGNSEWYTSMADKSYQERSLDMAQMAALNLDIQYKQLLMLEKIASLLSVSLANDLTPITKATLNKMEPSSR